MCHCYECFRDYRDWNIAKWLLMISFGLTLLVEYAFLRDLVIRSCCEKYGDCLKVMDWNGCAVGVWSEHETKECYTSTLQLLLLHASKVSITNSSYCRYWTIDKASMGWHEPVQQNAVNNPNTENVEIRNPTLKGLLINNCFMSLLSIRGDK